MGGDSGGVCGERIAKSVTVGEGSGNRRHFQVFRIRPGVRCRDHEQAQYEAEGEDDYRRKMGALLQRIRNQTNFVGYVKGRLPQNVCPPKWSNNITLEGLNEQ